MSSGKSSKKKLIGTSSAPAIWCSIEAETRLLPRSYFCTCWKVKLMAVPSSVWDNPSSVRRSLILVPT